MLEAPWRKTHTRKQIAEFSIPSGGTIFQLRASRVATMSPPGWLLVSKGDGHCIFNPLLGNRIELPSLQKLRCRPPLPAVDLDRLKRLQRGPNRIHTIALSSSPLLSRSYTTMISIHRDLMDHEPLGFAFLRSGEDAWTLVSIESHLPRSSVVRLVHYNGQFVALDAHNRIMTLNERKGCMQLQLALGKNFRHCGYLVECSGSLLVAWQIQGEGDAPVIRVFKVDLKKGTLEEVKSLGNVSLFLNYNSSFSVEFNAKYPKSYLKPNHIYFIDYIDKKNKIYSMDDGKVEWHCAGEWFQPDF
ncbi:hypothetical protein NL676_008696 [Syzygium grande]|nr:hypothetical protein NL676_008696 [Syzygium grande]